MTPSDSERHLRYAELLHEYRRNIVGFCSRRCGSGAEADDLMQEVFSALWQGMASLRADAPPAMVNRWMYRVMRTAWTRHRRVRSRMITIPPDKMPDPPAPHDDTAETVGELLAALDPDDQLLMRRHLEGFSTAELAREYNLKKETVKKRITRAKQKMRDIYLNDNGKRQ